MLDRFLPQRFDNHYRGSKLALWLFGVIVIVKAVQCLNSIFNGHSVATFADGIPVETFPSAAAQTVVSLFALLGLSQFMICLLGTLVLVRYRSMLPIMFALVLLQVLAGRLVLHFLPVVRNGMPPGFYVNLALLALMIAGLALSLRSPGNLRVQEL
jgi:hypothetical protein